MEVFQRKPHETNAVESHHQFSVGATTEILLNALMIVYKDMLAVMKFLALSEGITIIVMDKTPSGRQKVATQVNSARLRKSLRQEKSDGGPPDKDMIYVLTPKDQR